jgi:signal peptidase I
MKITIKKKTLYLWIGIVSSLLALFSTVGFLLIKFPGLLETRPSSISSYLTSVAPHPYVVYSGSMEPAIKTGSVIVSIPSKNYVQGDIITFSPSGSTRDLVTHRIAVKNYPEGVNAEPSYLTAGDANDDFDSWEITNDKIVGKVALSIPYLGYAADFAKTPKGFIFLVIIPATIVVYEELKMLKGEASKFFSRFFGKNRKKGSTIQINLLPKKENRGISKGFAIAPILGAFFVILAVSAAYFSDIEKSANNILGAAESYISPLRSSAPTNQEVILTETPTPTPTLSPSTTPTETETVTPTPEPSPTEIPLEEGGEPIQ